MSIIELLGYSAVIVAGLGVTLIGLYPMIVLRDKKS